MKRSTYAICVALGAIIVCFTIATVSFMSTNADQPLYGLCVFIGVIVICFTTIAIAKAYALSHKNIHLNGTIEKTK
jgi:hypothetical protein